MTDEKILDAMIEMFSEDGKWDFAAAGSGEGLKRHSGLENELKSKIKACLAGDDLTPYDMRQIRRHFELEDILRNEPAVHSHVSIYLHNLFVFLGLIEMRTLQSGSRKLLRSGLKHWDILRTW